MPTHSLGPDDALHFEHRPPTADGGLTFVFFNALNRRCRELPPPRDRRRGPARQARARDPGDDAFAACAACNADA
jgi:hypothetical protein